MLLNGCYVTPSLEPKIKQSPNNKHFLKIHVGQQCVHSGIMHPAADGRADAAARTHGRTVHKSPSAPPTCRPLGRHTCATRATRLLTSLFGRAACQHPRMFLNLAPGSSSVCLFHRRARARPGPPSGVCQNTSCLAAHERKRSCLIFSLRPVASK